MKTLVLFAFASIALAQTTQTPASIVVNPPRAESIVITAIPGQLACTITQDGASADIQWTIAGVVDSSLQLPAAAIAMPGFTETVTYGGASISISLIAITGTPGKGVQWTATANSPGGTPVPGNGSF